MNKIDTLIAYLFAIQAFAKDIHYSASGEAFYSKHLLADEIYKGIDEQIDALIETCILPNDTPCPIEAYWYEAMEITENITSEATFEKLLKLIQATIELINVQNNFSKITNSLIDDIGKDLQRKLGLITRQVG